MFPYPNDDKGEQDRNRNEPRPANPNNVINILYEQQQQTVSSSGLLNSMTGFSSPTWLSQDMFRTGAHPPVQTFHPTPPPMGRNDDQLRLQEQGRLSHVFSGAFSSSLGAVLQHQSQAMNPPYHPQQLPASLSFPHLPMGELEVDAGVRLQQGDKTGHGSSRSASMPPLGVKRVPLEWLSEDDPVWRASQLDAQMNCSGLGKAVQRFWNEEVEAGRVRQGAEETFELLEKGEQEERLFWTRLNREVYLRHYGKRVRGSVMLQSLKLVLSLVHDKDEGKPTDFSDSICMLYRRLTPSTDARDGDSSSSPIVPKRKRGRPSLASQNKLPGSCSRLPPSLVCPPCKDSGEVVGKKAIVAWIADAKMSWKSADQGGAKVKEEEEEEETARPMPVWFSSIVKIQQENNSSKTADSPLLRRLVFLGGLLGKVVVDLVLEEARKLMLPPEASVADQPRFFDASTWSISIPSLLDSADGSPAQGSCCFPVLRTVKRMVDAVARAKKFISETSQVDHFDISSYHSTVDGIHLMHLIQPSSSQLISFVALKDVWIILAPVAAGMQEAHGRMRLLRPELAARFWVKEGEVWGWSSCGVSVQKKKQRKKAKDSCWGSVWKR
ncbi:hypothetical protein GUITHDRAFT_141910 [Guillardia theta CCMP2712]|uniref:Uncharacterized protein n=1 Tax=Guillardia theta (strain CCMP2712) TaxID=905079 RepID=L1J006_GUITC|nr:hypothetical protein GUITHDRAFT_141910 [Guillardia theta CCMP2712]EKX41672.1 hypothetical protein GUITHDRAFT_141910 [Guillardia theta CCMP2712]|eukprot:XP_005828652.1 hypothetical protein GUITHDRAFT_141910 [Guillardia theta CCMP2712]